MGEAKRRREAIARGEPDPGIVGFRRRPPPSPYTPTGLADAGWARRAEARREYRAHLKIQRQKSGGIQAAKRALREKKRRSR